MQKRYSDIATSLLGFFLTFKITATYTKDYAARTLQVAFNDSWIFSDLAKRIAMLGTPKTEIFDLIYPPLYPLLISHAYLETDPQKIFELIWKTNNLVHCVLFFPLYFLLRSYCRLSKGLSLGFGVLLAVSPVTLHYTGWFLSESLYIPLVAILFMLVHFGMYRRSVIAALGFGLFLSLLPLAKAIGQIFVLTFFIVAILRLPPKRELPRYFFLLALVTIGLMAPVLINKLYFSTDITGSSYGSELEKGLRMKWTYSALRWKNMFLFYLYAPAVASGLFFLWLIVRRFKELFRDDFALFSAIAFGLHLIIVPLYTTSDAADVFHGRYIGPLVFTSTLIFFRYRQYLDKSALIMISLTSLALLALGMPCKLKPFAEVFSDGVYCSRAMVAWQISPSAFNIAATTLIIGSALILFKFRAFGLYLLFPVMGISFFHGNKLQAVQGIVRFSDLDRYSMAKAISQGIAENPNTTLYVDRKWRMSSGWVEAATVMFILPVVPKYINIEDLVQLRASAENFVLLTPQKLVDMQPQAYSDHFNVYFFTN